MFGRQERWQEDLFVAAPLRDLVPDDHILKRVDRQTTENLLRCLENAFQHFGGVPKTLVIDNLTILSSWVQTTSAGWRCKGTHKARRV